jgi:hypothetical protein
MQVRTERHSLSEALDAAQKELNAYKSATGRSLESLEAERTNKAALETRTRAQVYPALIPL